MSDDLRDSILPAIRKLAGDGAKDAELLRRWLHARDEAAFELLVWRHAALVLGVCQRVLRDCHAAEDAFQATFVVLLRKASTIAQDESLPAWLHRVALRVSMRARRRPLPALEIEPAVNDSEPDADLCGVVHEEIERLPTKYRLPIVLCYLEGKTHEQAASELGWPIGTVAGRVSRGRDMLRRRLERRGLTESLGPMVPAGWATQTETLLAAVRASTIKSSVMNLAQGVIQEMFWVKLRWAVLGLVCVCLFGLVATLAATRSADDKQPEKPQVQKKDDDDPLREAMDRARVRVQLKSIAGAIRHERFPERFIAPASLDRETKPLFSWRVEILPFLGNKQLYEEFKRDEPWDSQHNKRLLAKMPWVYASVGKANEGMTYFQFIVGPTAAYSDKRMNSEGYPAKTPLGRLGPVPRVKDFSDGAANTIVVVEAGEPIEWTRPDDVAYDPKKPLPKLGGQFASVIHALTADGTIHAIPRSTDEKTWRAAITINGGEEFQMDKVTGSIGATTRAVELQKLKERNRELTIDAAALKEMLAELKEEVRNLGWTVEREQAAKEDRDTAPILKKNAELEAAIKEAREEAKKLIDEVKRLGKKLDKKQ